MRQSFRFALMGLAKAFGKAKGGGACAPCRESRFLEKKYDGASQNGGDANFRIGRRMSWALCREDSLSASGAAPS